MTKGVAFAVAIFALAPLASAQDLLVSCPHTARGDLHRGQLHCHSTRSDGKQSPEELFRIYGGAGYDFVALTDHLKRARDPKVGGMTWIRASEVHTWDAQKGDGWGGHHIGALGIETEPSDWDRSTTSGVLARIGNEGGLAMANHPRLRNRWSTEQLVNTAPLQLVSIFNGRGYWRANQILPGSGSALFATASHWDQALAQGRILWGVAADDCHDVEKADQFNLGWVRVRAPSRREADLLDALRRGDFYACRSTRGKAPSLNVGAQRTIDGIGWTVTARSDVGVRLLWISKGKVIAKGTGPTLRYTPTGDEGTLRAEAIDPKSSDVRTYSQPLQVVAAPRLALTVTGDRVRVEFRDGADRRVVLRQPLRLTVRESEAGTLRLDGAEPSRAVVVPAGVSAVELRTAHCAGAVLEPDPASGWPRARFPK